MKPLLSYVWLSEEAVSSLESSRSMRLMGTIEGYDMMILLDSGSSHSFISAELADGLCGISVLQHILHVQVANGTHIVCLSHLRQAQWEIEGYSFDSDLKILHLMS
jgi:hypothetical protein